MISIERTVSERDCKRTRRAEEEAKVTTHETAKTCIVSPPKPAWNVAKRPFVQGVNFSSLRGGKTESQGRELEQGEMNSRKIFVKLFVQKETTQRSASAVQVLDWISTRFTSKKSSSECWKFGFSISSSTALASQAHDSGRLSPAPLTLGAFL